MVVFSYILSTRVKRGYLVFFKKISSSSLMTIFQNLLVLRSSKLNKEPKCVSSPGKNSNDQFMAKEPKPKQIKREREIISATWLGRGYPSRLLPLYLFISSYLLKAKNQGMDFLYYPGYPLVILRVHLVSPVRLIIKPFKFSYLVLDDVDFTIDI